MSCLLRFPHSPDLQSNSPPSEKKLTGGRWAFPEGSFTPSQNGPPAEPWQDSGLVVSPPGWGESTSTTPTGTTHKVGVWDGPTRGATPEHKLRVAFKPTSAWKSECCSGYGATYVWRKPAAVFSGNRWGYGWGCATERGRRQGIRRILFLDFCAAIKKGLCFSFSRASTPTSCMLPPTACVPCFCYGCSLR